MAQLLSSCAGRTLPPTTDRVQRVVNTDHAEKNNPYFKKALPYILQAIAAANGELWNLINDPAYKLDLVFQSTIAITENATYGLTEPLAFYGDVKKQKRIEHCVAEDIELHDQPITIVIDVVPPVMAFWSRTPGQAAATVAHEYAIHAERYVGMIKEIRRIGNTNRAVYQQLAKWQQQGQYEADVHHHSITASDVKDPYFASYLDLITRIAGLYRAAGMEEEAKNVEKSFKEDVSEHQTQEKVAGLWNSLKKKLSV